MQIPYAKGLKMDGKPDGQCTKTRIITALGACFYTPASKSSKICANYTGCLTFVAPMRRRSSRQQTRTHEKSRIALRQFGFDSCPAGNVQSTTDSSANRSAGFSR